MFTWVHAQMDFSPILYVTGPTMECGKTTLLNVIAKMARRPAKTANVSAPAIYRLSELYHPSLLMDEAQDQLNDRDFWLVIKAALRRASRQSGGIPTRTNRRLLTSFVPNCWSALAGQAPKS
jgi:hypothetical protein